MATTAEAITLQQDGRRIYLTGNTYPVKDQIRDAGGKWDADRKAWYVGVQRRDVAERIVAALAASPAPPIATSERPTETLAEDATEIAGRATYHGRTYYVLGRVNRGRTHWDDEVVITRSARGYVRLAYRDGSRVFWAAETEVRIDKRYPRLASIASLRRYAEEAKQREAEHGCGCSCHESAQCRCPGFCSYHHDGCDRCGCES